MTKDWYFVPRQEYSTGDGGNRQGCEEKSATNFRRCDEPWWWGGTKAMGGLDLGVLLRPVSDVSSCGDNLEYDPDFGELERAAEGTSEHVIGNAITKAEPPDWPAVVRIATELFHRTKDLRVAMRLARALLVTEAIPGFRDGLELIARLLAENWDEVHPRLDPEDGNDPTLRVNILAELCSPETVLKDLRSAPLARSHALGTVSYRHVALATGELKPVDGPVPKDMAEIKAVFLDCDAEELLATAVAARECVRLLKQIEDVLGEKVNVSRALDIAPALSLMRNISRFVDERVAERGLVAAPDSASEDVSQQTPENLSGNGAASPPLVISTEVSSRDEVVRLLDRICAYYEKHEPSSPVPLLLARAKRLVSKDFMDILRDIAPDAVAQAEAIRGRDST